MDEQAGDAGTDQPVGRAADDQPCQATVAVRAHHDKVHAVVGDEWLQQLTGKAALDEAAVADAFTQTGADALDVGTRRRRGLRLDRIQIGDVIAVTGTAGRPPMYLQEAAVVATWAADAGRRPTASAGIPLRAGSRARLRSGCGRERRRRQLKGASDVMAAKAASSAAREQRLAAAHPPARAAKRARRLTENQLAAMVYVMRLFVEDDLALGVPASATILCPACEAQRPRAGAIPYDRYLVCNECATEYEIARVTAGPLSIGQYLRDKRYGDGARYELPSGLRSVRHREGAGRRRAC